MPRLKGIYNRTQQKISFDKIYMLKKIWLNSLIALKGAAFNCRTKQYYNIFEISFKLHVGYFR